MSTRRKYIEVRKVKWDALWHAVFINSKGETSWDRVSRAEALKLSKHLS
jgi:hypothetical protein